MGIEHSVQMLKPQAVECNQLLSEISDPFLSTSANSHNSCNSHCLCILPGWSFGGGVLLAAEANAPGMSPKAQQPGCLGRWGPNHGIRGGLP